MDTRDINELGAGKFRTSAKDEKQQTYYFNKINSDSYFKSFILQRAQADPIIFSILKERSDINFQHKNLDIYVNSSVLNGNSKERLHQSYSKNINNGSSRSSRLYDNIAKSADARKRRRSRESAGPDRRKPKFLK